MEKMLFKLGCTVRRLDIHSEEPIELSFEGSDQIKLVIRAPDKEERAIGHKSFNAFCDAIGEFEPTRKAKPVFEAMLEDKRPPDRKKAKTAEDMVVRDGPCYGLESYPNPFISFVEKINKTLSTHARTAVSFLRWRYAQEGPPAPISTRGLSWSNDSGINWLPLPGVYSLTCVNPPSSILKVKTVSIEDLKQSVQFGLEEPVYHELLREAKELKFNSSRSSILVALSAAEVAVKGVLYKLVPKGNWLIENIQSPPLVKIIKDCFPQIIPAEKFSKVKEEIERLAISLEKAIFIRNQVAHRGEQPPSDDKVEEIIQIVGQLLWICDYCSGYNWAGEYLDHEIKQ